MKRAPAPGEPKKPRRPAKKVQTVAPERPEEMAPPQADSRDAIARRAYEIYLQRISRTPLDDWLQAEREILARREQQ